MRIGLMVAATLLSAANAAAQDAPRDTTKRAAIAGTVTDTTGRPIPGVEVLVDDTDIKVVTDDSGRFHAPGIPAGKNGFVVRKIGYTAVSFETNLDAGKTLILQVHLRRTQTLAAATIAGEKRPPGLARVGFYERQHQGLGNFLEPNAIDSLSSVTSPAQLLRNVPGLDIRCAPGGCTVNLSSPPYCLQLFVDGQYVNDQVDRVLTTSEVGAMEVYRHIGEIPIEFQAPLAAKRSTDRDLTAKAGCGVLAVWTKLKTMP